MGNGEFVPAMIAAMTDVISGDFTGIHRTHLLSDGSGKGALGKRILGTARQSIVRLRDEPGEIAAIAEGIETALSTPILIGTTPPKVIAALSAGTMKTMLVPPGIANFEIMMDADNAGLDAATHFAESCKIRGKA